MLVVNKDRLFFGKYGVVHLVHNRVLLIWQIAKFCNVHLILGLIYPIRANAHEFIALKFSNPMEPETN